MLLVLPDNMPIGTIYALDTWRLFTLLYIFIPGEQNQSASQMKVREAD